MVQGDPISLEAKSSQIVMHHHHIMLMFFRNYEDYKVTTIVDLAPCFKPKIQWINTNFSGKFCDSVKENEWLDVKQITNPKQILANLRYLEKIVSEIISGDCIGDSIVNVILR